MKKILSIFLSLMLVVSSLSSVLIFPTSAADPDAVAEDYFETLSNWKAYTDANGVGSSATEYSYGNTGSSAGFFSLKNDVKNDSEYSVKSTARGGLTAVYLPKLEANTEYTLHIEWCYTNTSATKPPFEYLGLIATNGGMVLANNSANYMEGTYLSRTTGYAVNTWHTRDIVFNSGNNTEIVFVMRTNSADDVYFDNFKLTTKGYFETLSNWKAYTDASGVGSSATEYSYGNTGSSAGFFSLNSASVNGSSSSVKSTARGGLSAVYLPKLEANTEYTLHIEWCYTNTTATKPPFEYLGLIATNGGMVLANNSENYMEGTYLSRATSYAVNTWHTRDIVFNSGNNTEIVFVMRTNSADDVYFDNFSLVATPKTEYFEDPANVKVYSYYDADNVGGNGTVGSATTPLETAVTAGTIAKDGKTINTFYTRAFGSYVAIVLPVTEENTDYTFTFDYYFDYDDDAVDSNKKDVLQYGGIMAADGIAVNPLSDTDKYIGDSRFNGPTTTPVDQTWFSKTFTFNSGEHTEILFVARLRANGNEGKYTAYFSNFCLTATTTISVEYAKETAKLVPTDGLSFEKAVIGEPFTFTMKKANGITATVKYNGKAMTAKDSVYTIDQVANGGTLSVTTSGETGAQAHAVNVGMNGEKLDEYNADVYSKKFWEGDTVYQEAVMFTNPSDSQSEPQLTKKLLYPIDDVVSVRSNDLKTWYVKGVDYTITENGELQWLEGSDIPVYEGALAALQKEADVEEDSTVNKDGYSTYAAGYPINDTHGLQIIAKDSIHEAHTVYVTYTHSKSWDGIDYSKVTSKKQGSNLANLYQKLKNGEDINVLVYGDSVATGASSSGMRVNYPSLSVGVNTDNSSDLIWEDQLTWSAGSESNGYAPYAPTFFEQATDAIIQEYGNNNKASYWNIAAGGRSSQWGLANLPLRLEKFKEYTNDEVTPDLVYIKFAANEVSRAAEEYKGYIQGMVDLLQEEYPGVNIIILSGKVNNTRAIQYNYNDSNQDKVANGYPTKVNYQAEQEAALYEIANSNVGVIAVGTFTAWREITKNKATEDYLTNNINHGNDFWAKTTAQLIVDAVEIGTPVVTAYNQNAAIRTENHLDGSGNVKKNGLRVYNSISIDRFEMGGMEIVEYGSFAIREGFKTRVLEHEGATALDLALANRYNGHGVGLGVAYRAKNADTITGNTAVEETVWEKQTDESGKETIVFTSYLTGIVPEYFDDEYHIVAYAIDNLGNVYYGDVASVSIFKVAQAISMANDTEKVYDNDAFSAFVIDANLESTYEAWCKEYNLQCGGLYDALTSSAE